MVTAVIALRYFVAPPETTLLGLKAGWHRPMLLLHTAGGVVALLIGPFQFWKHWRDRNLKRHRLLGKIYLIAVLLGGLAGAFVATGANGGPSARVGFAFLSVGWLVTGWLAWRRILTRDIQAHYEWMLRNFALTFAAVTLRLWLPLLQMSGFTFAEAFQTAAWLCWVPNLVVVEVFLGRQRGA